MPKRFLWVLTPLILAWIAEATAPAVAGDWPLSRGDARGTGVAHEQLADEYELAWTFTTQDIVKSAPIVAAGVVYVGSNDAHIYAIDLATGELRWKRPLSGAVEAPPMFHGGTIYVGTFDGFLYALNPADGAEKWRYTTGSQILDSATPASIGDRAVVLFGSYDNQLHCVDAQTGEKVWSYLTEGYVHGAPAVDGQRAVFGGCDGFLYVLDLADGTLVGRTRVDGQFARMPAIADGYAILGHYRNAVVSIDLTRHAVAWEFYDRDFPYVSAAAVSGDIVVIGSRARRVYGLNRVTGEEIWTHRPHGAVDSSPVIAGERVVFASNDGKVYVVALADGEPIWAYEIGAPITAAPAVADGWIVVGVEDNNIYAFRPKQGADNER